MLRVRILLITSILSLVLMAQNEVPTVGQEAADRHLVLLAQQGWRPQGASLSFDGRTLYLSLRRPPREVHDLYVCHLVGQRWQQPIRLDALSSDHNEFSPSVSSDECSLFFIRQDVVAEGTRREQVKDMLYFSERNAGGDWPEAQWMLLSNGADASPRFMADGRHLFFTSQGREEDERRPVPHRYVVTRMDKYNWTLPERLADPLAEDTLAQPVRRLEGQVSNSRTQRAESALVQVFDRLTDRLLQEHPTDEQGRFLVALPMDQQVRVEVSKAGFTKAYISPSDSLLQYFPVALTPELTICLTGYDSETMARITPRAFVRDAETDRSVSVRMTQDPVVGSWTMHLPIGHAYSVLLTCPAYADTTLLLDTRKDVLMPMASIDVLMHVGHTMTTIRWFDSETQELIADAETSVRLLEDEEDSSVSFSSPGSLRCGARYLISGQAPRYFFRDTVWSSPMVEGPSVLEMELRRMRLSDVVQLRNIQFEFNSYVLREESYTELHRVAELLRRNPSVRIELSAHTDDVGSADYNLRLSERRGESARQYLIDEEHIPAEQIISRGYGKTRPLVPNDSDEHRALNRRVEFSIIEL